MIETLSLSHTFSFLGSNCDPLCDSHMGSLKSMRYGSLIKAIYKFTMVRQNYGKWLLILSLDQFLFNYWNNENKCSAKSLKFVCLDSVNLKWKLYINLGEQLLN